MRGMLGTVTRYRTSRIASAAVAEHHLHTARSMRYSKRHSLCVHTANCITVAQNFHLFYCFSGALCRLPLLRVIFTWNLGDYTSMYYAIRSNVMYIYICARELVGLDLVRYNAQLMLWLPQNLGAETLLQPHPTKRIQWN